MTTTEVTLLVFGILVIVLVGITIVYYLRHHHLRQRFGPEYDRVADKAGPLSADRELRDRERRHAQLHLNELDPQTKAWYVEQWQRVQAGFVESPETAIGGADELVTRLIGERGYPVRDYDEQVALLSVDHARVIDHYRLAHDIAQQHARGHADTEALRQALMHYRVLVGDILGTEDGLTADALPDGAHPGDINAHAALTAAAAGDTTAARETIAHDATMARDGTLRREMPRAETSRDSMPRNEVTREESATARETAAADAIPRDAVPRDAVPRDRAAYDETPGDTAAQAEVKRDETAPVEGAVYGAPAAERERADRERADRDPADDAAAEIAAREADTDELPVDANAEQERASASAADADVAQRAAAARGARVQGTAKVPQGKKTIANDQLTPSDVDQGARR